MITFHAQRLELLRCVHGGTTSDGVPLPDTIEVAAELPCQIVPGSQSKMVYSDGESIHYTFHIFLPKDCPTMAVGDMVRLYGTDGDEIVSSSGFRVLQFFRYQLSCQIWV